MHDIRPKFLVLSFGNPLIIKTWQTTQDGPSNPREKLPVKRRNYFHYITEGSQLLELIRESFRKVSQKRISSTQNDVTEHLLMNASLLNSVFDFNYVFVHSKSVLTDYFWIEQYFRAHECLSIESDYAFVWELKFDLFTVFIMK